MMKEVGVWEKPDLSGKCLVAGVEHVCVQGTRSQRKEILDDRNEKEIWRELYI